MMSDHQQRPHLQQATMSSAQASSAGNGPAPQTTMASLMAATLLQAFVQERLPHFPRFLLGLADTLSEALLFLLK